MLQLASRPWAVVMNNLLTDILNATIIIRYAALAPAEKVGLREILFRWIREYLAQHPEEPPGIHLFHSWHLDGTKSRTAPIAIKNKLAYLIVLVFKQDYLTQWPTFFSELFNLLQLVYHLAIRYSRYILMPVWCFSGTGDHRYVSTNHQNHWWWGREQWSDPLSRGANAQHSHRNQRFTF